MLAVGVGFGAWIFRLEASKVVSSGLEVLGWDSDFLAIDPKIPNPQAEQPKP